MDVPLTQGKVCQIDDEDWPLVSGYSWHAKLENGGLWYAATSVIDPAIGEQVTLKTHRVITGAGADDMVDHKESSQTLDNRRSNLRICSNALNQQNTSGRGGSSRFKGVSWSARKKKWLVQFRHDGRYHFVGHFLDEEQAAKAYDVAIAPLAGEFARLNFSTAA
jgi:hypothetical protein